MASNQEQLLCILKTSQFYGNLARATEEEYCQTVNSLGSEVNLTGLGIPVLPFTAHVTLGKMLNMGFFISKTVTVEWQQDNEYKTPTPTSNTQ